MKNLLIIGGCGYAGSALFQYLSKSYNVDTLDLEWFGNYCNPDNFKKDFSTVDSSFLSKYDSVILLAGHSSVKMCEDVAQSVVKNNVLNFCSLISKISKDQKFIYASSSSVYGDTKSRTVDEEYNDFCPNNYYDLSKYEIDSYAKLSQINYFGLRFGTINGTSVNFRSDVMINAMTFNAITDGEVFCFNPDVNRPILGMSDLCRCIEVIINSGGEHNKGIYNLASFNTSAETIAKAVANTTNANLKILKEPPKLATNLKLQSNAYDFLIDTSKFQKVFEFTFSDTPSSITESIVKNFKNINKEGRLNAKLY